MGVMPTGRLSAMASRILRFAPQARNFLLFQSITKKNNPALRAHIEAGTEVNVLNADGMSPLQVAVSHNNIYAILALTKAGANPYLGSKHKKVAFEGMTLKNLLEDLSDKNNLQVYNEKVTFFKYKWFSTKTV